MKEIIETLAAKADLVIIDGPPFIVADAPLLASKVNGMLLIVQLEHTREQAIKAMMEQIRRAGAKVVGVALNRIPAKSIGYYTGHPHYASYYSEEDEIKGSSSSHESWREKLNFWPFNRSPRNKRNGRKQGVFDEIDIIENDEGFGWRD